MRASLVLILVLPFASCFSKPDYYGSKGVFEFRYSDSDDQPFHQSDWAPVATGSRLELNLSRVDYAPLSFEKLESTNDAILEVATSLFASNCERSAPRCSFQLRAKSQGYVALIVRGAAGKILDSFQVEVSDAASAFLTPVDERLPTKGRYRLGPEERDVKAFVVDKKSRRLLALTDWGYASSDTRIARIGGYEYPRPGYLVSFNLGFGTSRTGPTTNVASVEVDPKAKGFAALTATFGTLTGQMAVETGAE